MTMVLIIQQINSSMHKQIELQSLNQIFIYNIFVVITMTEVLYFTNQNTPQFQQIIIAAAFLNQTITTQQINNKYAPLNLVTPQGILSQPNTILNYLVRDQLAPLSEEQQIELHQWFEFFNMELHPLLNEIIGQMNKQKTANKQRYDYSLRQLVRVLQIINSHLRIRTVFIGNSITAVDISLATHLEIPFKTIVSQQTRRRLSNVSRWFTFLRSTPPFLKLLGPLTFCPKDQQFKVAEEKGEKAQQIKVQKEKEREKRGETVSV